MNNGMGGAIGALGTGVWLLAEAAQVVRHAPSASQVLLAVIGGGAAYSFIGQFFHAPGVGDKNH